MARKKFYASTIITAVVLLLAYHNFLAENENVVDDNLTCNGSRMMIYSLYTGSDNQQGSRYHPVCSESYYNSKNANSLDVVPRRAYYLNRTAFGKYYSILYVVTQVHDDSGESILACEINGYQSEIYILKQRIAWERRAEKGITHSVFLVQCLGIPRHFIQNNSVVKLIYKNRNDSCYIYVKTEKPLILINPDNPTPIQGNRSVVVCTALFANPELLNPWLKYQKVIGVDMVKLNVHPNFCKNVDTFPFLRKAIDSGFVRMEVWNEFVGERMFYHAQYLKNLDCVLECNGIFEYAVVNDYDDFFNPSVPGKKDIRYYIDKYFLNETIGSIRFWWKQNLCRPNVKCSLTEPEGNMTKCLTGETAKWREPSKCIHKLTSIVSVSPHGEERFLPGYMKFLLTEKEVAYFAHNKMMTKMCEH